MEEKAQKSVLQQAAELERRLAKLEDRFAGRRASLTLALQEARLSVLAEYPKEVQEKAGVAS